MAAGPTLKSLNVSNADASPRVASTAGEGGPYKLNQVDGYVTAAAADGAGTKYILARLNSTVKVKAVTLASEAQGAGKVDVGVYYADNANDLAPGNVANLGVAIDSNFFGSDVDLASKVQPTDVTFEQADYTFDKWFQPLWQALGLTSDPGGKLDIVATVHTTDITTGTGKIYLRVTYAE